MKIPGKSVPVPAGCLRLRVLLCVDCSMVKDHGFRVFRSGSREWWLAPNLGPPLFLCSCVDFGEYIPGMGLFLTVASEEGSDDSEEASVSSSVTDSDAGKSEVEQKHGGHAHGGRGRGRGRVQPNSWQHLSNDRVLQLIINYSDSTLHEIQQESDAVCGEFVGSLTST